MVRKQKRCDYVIFREEREERQNILKSISALCVDAKKRRNVTKSLRRHFSREVKEKCEERDLILQNPSNSKNNGTRYYRNTWEQKKSLPKPPSQV